jgi:hypothetical protein
LDLEVRGFESKKFEEFLRPFEEIHCSDLSIYGAKAKLHRLALPTDVYKQLYWTLVKTSKF